MTGFISFDLRPKQRTKGRVLIKIASLFDVLNFEEDDEIVNLAKEVNSLFRYPLEDEKIFPDISYDDVELTVGFPDDSLFLTDIQKDDLRKRSLNYARRNLRL